MVCNLRLPDGYLVVTWRLQGGIMIMFFPHLPVIMDFQEIVFGTNYIFLSRFFKQLVLQTQRFWRVVTVSTVSFIFDPCFEVKVSDRFHFYIQFAAEPPAV